jgi:hypothetical protein
MCLRALKSLASYHYTETVCGKTGLSLHTAGLKDPGGNLQEGILSRFLHSLLQLLLFEDYRSRAHFFFIKVLYLMIYILMSIYIPYAYVARLYWTPLIVTLEVNKVC